MRNETPTTIERLQAAPTPYTGTPSSDEDSKPKAVGITPRRLMHNEKTQGISRFVYMIRHGQSRGQVANRDDRRFNETLTDCGLTDYGIFQANNIRDLMDISSIDLVICSPLTRAVHTALLGFPGHTILCNYDLREVGSMIPENIPRETKNVVADLEKVSLDVSKVDFETNKPARFPKRHDSTPKVVRRDRIRQVFSNLAEKLPKEVKNIAVVCHYHVIKTALKDPFDARQSSHVDRNLNPQNAEPIRCLLSEDGALRLATVEESGQVANGEEAMDFDIS